MPDQANEPPRGDPAASATVGWTGQQVAAFGLALLGSTPNWRARLAERLGATAADVEKWTTEGAPAAIAARLLELVGARDMTAFVTVARDEWIVGEGPPRADGGRREYVIHTHPPRFIARVIAVHSDSLNPDPDEQPAVVTTGIVYQADEETVLAEIQWIDPVPQDPDLHMLFEAAADALERNSDDLL